MPHIITQSPKNPCGVCFVHSFTSAVTNLKVGIVIMKFEPFTTTNGLITQTLKTKRNVVTERFSEEIDALYASKR